MYLYKNRKVGHRFFAIAGLNYLPEDAASFTSLALSEIENSNHIAQ
jgi:hypothetical protein